jgi:hypothetical protein
MARSTPKKSSRQRTVTDVPKIIGLLERQRSAGDITRVSFAASQIALVSCGVPMLDQARDLGLV